MNEKDFFIVVRFTEEYFKDPYRGYGGSIMAVFSKLKDAEFADPYKPAAEQFDGEGSYGNGGAMRIVPAPLFAYRQNDVQHLTVSIHLTFFKGVEFLHICTIEF